jgi:hypothetical protein
VKNFLPEFLPQEVKSEEFLCKQSVLKKRLPTGVPVGAEEGMAAANSSFFILHSSL